MEDFLMTNKERERERVFISVKSRSISLIKASHLLNLSYSHTRRLWSHYKKFGPEGLISQKRGIKSNRATPDDIKTKMVQIIADELYGCKPRYVSEILADEYGFKYSSEFVRKLMIKHHLWIPKKSNPKVHQRRQRRSCEGELSQTDASDHDWFEGRLLQNGKAIKAHLHIFIDDATSTIYGAYFDYQETTNGYFQAAKAYFEKKGVPKSLYNDKRSTFTVNNENNRGITQFARAMKELNVEMIFAHSPEAKGRVERAFGILQERLVWEMRRHNISTLEEANEFLPQYLELHNKKFAKKPACTFDAHRPLDHKRPLKYILCNKEKRTMFKNLEVQYNNTIYQMEISKGEKKPARKVKVTVIKTLEGELQFALNGKFLKYKKFKDLPFVEEKPDLLKIHNSKKNSYKPSKHHPWKSFSSSLKRAASVAATFLSTLC